MNELSDSETRFLNKSLSISFVNGLSRLSFFHFRLNPSQGDADVAEALRRIPQHEVDARHQRLRRAHDLYLKKEILPAELQVC